MEKSSKFFELIGRNVLHNAQTSEESKKILEEDPTIIARPDISNIYPIHLAASNGSVNRVTMLHESGADLDVISVNGKSPLHYAAITDNSPVIEYLIEHDVDINRKDFILECTPCLYASIFSCIRSVLVLIKAGCNIHATDSTGRNILHYAAWNYQIALTSVLLCETDIDIEQKDNNGCTPLHYAAGVGSKEIVRLLVNESANLLSMNNDGHIPLHLASAGGHYDVVEQFLSFGVPLDYTSSINKNTPAHYAAMSSNLDLLQYFLDCQIDITNIGQKSNTILHSAAMGGYLDNIRTLVELGANMIVENDNRQTPLHICAKYGYDDCVEFLHRKAPHTAKYRDSNDYTPMNLAAFGKHIGSFEILLNEEATHLQWKDKNKMTQLHWASCAGHSTMVRELLQNRASLVNDTDKNGRTALHWAISSNSVDCFRILMEHSASSTIECNNGNTAFHYAAMISSSDIMSMLLDLKSVSVGTLINQSNNNSLTPLLIAATYGNSDIVSLLSAYTNIDNSIKDKDGNSAIYKAIQSGCSLKSIEGLTGEMDKNLELKNNLDETPLHIACKSDSSIDIVLWLLEMKEVKYINEKNSNGHTALHIAANFNAPIVVNALLKYNADPTLIDNDSKTPLDYAIEQSNLPCVHLLDKF